MDNHFEIKDFFGIKKKYILAFSMIFVFSFMAQALIQYYLSSQKDYSSVINLAGRQRMLSQRIAYLSLLNQVGIEMDEHNSELILEANKKFVSTHYNLKFGNTKENIPKAFNDELFKEYEQMDSLVEEISVSVKCITSKCPLIQDKLKNIGSKTDNFLIKMNNLVFKLDAIVKEKVISLSVLEYSVFFLITCLMLYEFLLVLIPFQKKIILHFIELVEENKQKERLYQLAEVGEMSAEVTHEINNFLTVISGTTRMIQSKITKSEGPKDERLILHLAKIQKNVERIKSACSGMSKLSRISSISSFELMDLIDDINEMFEDKFKKHKITFEVEGNLKHKVKTNKVQVIQVLFNLIKNSIHAMENTLDDKKIIFSASIKGDFVNLAISDTGPGVPEDAKTKIMTAFFTTKGEGKGTGLGLSLSSKIAHGLGGELVLRDTDYSTTFNFSFKSEIED